MFDAIEAINDIIDDINTEASEYSESCYNDIYDELCCRVESGDLTLEEAEMVNRAAYEKYCVFSENVVSNIFKKVKNVISMKKDKNKKKIQRITNFKLINDNLYESNLLIDDKKLFIKSTNGSIYNPDFIANINITFVTLSKYYKQECLQLLKGVYKQKNKDFNLKDSDIHMKKATVSEYFDKNGHGIIDYAIEIDSRVVEIDDLKECIFHWMVDTCNGGEIKLRLEFKYR